MTASPATARPDRWKDRFLILPFFLVFLLSGLLTLQLPFFWDKDILYSRIAHWLLENRFNPVLPDSMDPGYPPVLAYLLAAAWKVCGISLPVMHLLMLPFTLGVVWQSFLLLRQFLPGRKPYAALLLVLADTTFLAQTVVFSTDLVMLFFMVLALNSVLKGRRFILAMAVAGLLFSHMRGLTVAATIGIFDLYRNRMRKWPRPGLLIPYLPGLALFGVWAAFHYHTKGWIGYHDGSPWAPCYEPVDIAGFARNCLIVAWRLLDFGHVFVWIAAAILIHPILRNRKAWKEPLPSLLLLLIVSFLLTLPPMLFYRMLNGHRYLIPVYYMGSVLAVYLIYGSPGKEKLKKSLGLLMLAGLLSGNFWVYPDNVAKGWDATLAHLPYHHLRMKMRQYMDRYHIPVDQTGSRIPNTAVIGYIECTGDPRAFPLADLTTQPYIFYSNICNSFTDEEIATLKRDWTVQQEYRCLRVRVTLYRRD